MHNRWRHWKYAVIGGGAFLVSALLSAWVVRQSSGLTAVWPCNAIIVALLVHRERRAGERVAILLGAFLGSLLSGFVRGESAFLYLGFGVANTLESLVAATIIVRMGGVSGTLDRVADVKALIIASVIAPLVPALIGATALHIAMGIPARIAWLNWYGAAALGLTIVTPTLVFVLNHARAGAPGHRLRHPGEAAALLGLIALFALGAFYFPATTFYQVPLMFAILPLLTLATFRMRQFGAITGIAIVTIVAAEATVGGLGPIAKAGLAPGEQLVLLQFFLALTLLTALPVAAALTERDMRSEEARMLAEQYRMVVENIDKVVFRIDGDGRWTYLNPAWEAVTGLAVAATVGRPWSERLEAESADELADWAAPVISGEVKTTRRMIRFQTASQGERWMEISFQGLRDESGGMIGLTGTMRDVDDRKRLSENVLLAKRRAEERAREATMLAATDELTGLANRRAFSRHLERMLDRANIINGRLALAIFDVDHFKDINDGYGHDVGDRVLQRVATRALQVVRGGDVIGRIGGEEFGILMPGASLDDARAAAERLREAIQRPSREGEEDLPRVTVSVGIAAAAGEQLPAVLTQEADRALYQAKREGRNRVRIAA